RAALPGRQPRRHRALVRDRHRGNPEPAHPRRAAQEPARRVRHRSQLVEGAFAMTRKRMAVVPPLFMLGLLPLAGCAASRAQTPPQAAEALVSAIPEPEPPRKLEIVRIPEPLPLPGQLKPIRTSVAPD